MAVTLQVCYNKMKDNRDDAEQNLSSGNDPDYFSMTNQGTLHTRRQLSVDGSSFISGILHNLMLNSYPRIKIGF